MLKKTVTYTNFDGQEVSEDFYFNLSKGEVIEMQMSEKDGLDAKLQRIVASKNQREIIETFRWILKKSVGRRSEDGRKFIKNDEITSDFMDSGAYDEVLVELLTNDGASVAFVNGVVPNLAQVPQNNGPIHSNVAVETPTETDNRPAWIRENRDPSETELRAMGKEELLLAMRRKSQSLGSTSDGTAAKTVN